MDIARSPSDLVQYMYAGRLLMQECRKGRLCMVFLNNKGVARTVVANVLGSSMQISSCASDYLDCCLGEGAAGVIFQYPDDDQSCIINALPLIRDSGLVLHEAWDDFNSTSSRRVDELCMKLCELLSQRRCVCKAPQTPREQTLLRQEVCCLEHLGLEYPVLLDLRVTRAYSKKLPLIHALASLREDPQPYMSVSLNQGGVGWHVDKNNCEFQSDTLSLSDCKEDLASLFVELDAKFVVAYLVESPPKKRRGQTDEYYYDWNSADEGLDETHAEFTKFKYKGDAVESV
eukprot:3173481-Amphidinium_carterae.2